MRRRVIESVLNEILGLHNKPEAGVHPEHKPTGLKKKKEKEEEKKEEKKSVTEVFVSVARLPQSYENETMGVNLLHFCPL